MYPTGAARTPDVEPEVLQADLHEPQGRHLSDREGQGRCASEASHPSDQTAGIGAAHGFWRYV